MARKAGDSVAVVSSHVRKMVVEDLTEVMRIESISFANPWSLSMFKSFFNDRFSFAFVLEQKDVIAGYAMGWIVEDYAELANIAVDPSFRRRGFAGRLIEKVTGICRQKNVSGLFLEVRQSNSAASSLYRSYGFRHVGQHEAYYPNPREDALIYMLEF